MVAFAQMITRQEASYEARVTEAKNAASRERIASASFAHAVVALAAKLACVDGTPTKAEYAAFHALFVAPAGGDAAQLRSLFVKRITDSSPALQYARQIAAASGNDIELYRDLLQRLILVASADAALNAAEIELLRAVADIFGLERETFRSMVAKTLVPIGASPYDILGLSPQVSDQELRDQYMARVQMLHPDRYHAAGASAETIAMLTDQLAAVNAAYKAVQGLRARKTMRSAGSSAWWSRRNAKGAKV